MDEKEINDFVKEYQKTVWKKFEEDFVRTQPIPPSAGKILTDSFKDKESANNG